PTPASSGAARFAVRECDGIRAHPKLLDILSTQVRQDGLYNAIDCQPCRVVVTLRGSLRAGHVVRQTESPVEGGRGGLSLPIDCQIWCCRWPGVRFSPSSPTSSRLSRCW